MSHAVKYYIVHKTKNGPTFRVELLEDGFVGSSTRKLGGGEIFTLDYDSLDPKTVFSNPVQRSRLTLYLQLETKSDITILSDIFNSVEDKYRLRLKVDGSTYWEGAVLADLMEYPEGKMPSVAKITAKDLSRLKGQTYTLTSGRDDIITVIADLLFGLGLGLGIKTATSWTEKNISDSNDFLDEISLEKGRIRKFATADGETDQPYNKLEVLEMICKNFGLILRQQDGYWWITQITEQANDPVTVFEYNSSGTFVSSSSVDLDAPVDKVNRWLQPQGQNKHYVGIDRAEVTFRHNTKEQVLHLPDRITLTSSNSSIDPIDFISDGSQKIEFSCNVRATESGDAAKVSAFIEFRIGSSGNYYYLTRDSNGDLEWNASVNDLEIELNDFSGGPGFPGIDDQTIDTDGVWEKRFGVEFTTPTTPANADGTYRITFKPAQDLTGTPAIVDETLYYNIQQEIVNPTISENNKSVFYTREQAGTGFSETFDFGDTWFGDGPASYSKSALTWFDGVKNVATVSEWRRDGGTAELALQVLLLRELLDIQRNHIEGKRAALLGDYKTQQILTTDSGNTRYFFLSGQLSGKRAEWDAYFFRININTAGDDSIGTFYDDPDDTGTGGGGGGGNPPPTGPVGKLTESISGSRTSIKIEAFTKITSGKDYYIYNAAKRKNISITPTETVDVGNHTIAIQSQTIIAPEGSYIVREPGQDETDKTIFDSRITENDSEISANVAAISDNSTANSNLTLLVDEQSQSNAIGTISAEVSGTTTSISLENTPFEVKLDDGDELTILSNDKKDEGNRESFTVNGDQTLTAGTNTLAINSKSFANTYPVGSYVYESQAALTARATISARLSTENESGLSSLSLSVSEGREAQAIGLTSAQVSGSTSSIGLTDVPFEIKLDNNDTLRILSLVDADEGNSEEFTVNGDQTLTAGTDTININAKTFSNTYPVGSSVFEPASSLTARATLAVRTSSDNSSSISSLDLRVTDNEATAVLKAEVTSGEITKIAFVKLESSVGSGSAITLAADQIRISGTTTFDSGYDPSDGRVIIRQASEPTTRPSGDPLKSGDLWIDTDDGDKPYSWNGSAFELSNTIVEDLRVTIRQDAEPTTRPSGDPLKDGDMWIDTNDGDRPYTWNGTSWIGAYTIIDGSTIQTGAIESTNFSAGSSGWQIDTNGDAEFNSITIRGGDHLSGSLENLDVSGTLTMGASGKIVNSSSPSDFRVDSDGFTVLTNASWTPARAYVVEGATSGTAVGGLYGNTGAIFLHGEGSNDVVLDAQKINNSGLVRFAHRSITLDSNGLLAVDSSGVGPRTFITVAPYNNASSDTLEGFRILSDGNTPEAGTVLILQAALNDQITINDGSENINTGVGNVTLGDGGQSEVAMFIYSDVHDSWKLVNHTP